MAGQLPYVLVDEFGLKDADGVLTGGLLKNVKDALGLPVLNYQFGYFDELTETLSQYSMTEQFSAKKFPLIWVEQPFTIDRENVNVFGETIDLRLFIIHETDKTYKADKRLS